MSPTCGLLMCLITRATSAGKDGSPAAHGITSRVRHAVWEETSQRISTFSARAIDSFESHRVGGVWECRDL